MAFCEALRLAIFAGLALQLRDELVSFRVEVRRHLAFHTAGGIRLLPAGRLWRRQRTSHSTPLLSPGRLLWHPTGHRGQTGCQTARVSSPALRGSERFRRRPAARRGESWVPALFGEPKPMMVLHISRDGFVGDRPRFFYRAFDGVSVVTVHAAHHVPAVGFKAFRGVVGEPAFNVAVDGDAVVIIERHQFTQFPGYRPGSTLREKCLPSCKPSPMKA